MQVGGGAVDAAQAHRARKGRRGDARSLMAHQLFARQLQQLRLAAHLGAEPAFQAGARAHIARQLLIVEGMDQVIVDQHVLAARLVLQLLHLADEALVVGQEGQLGLPLALHQRLADEDLTRRSGVHQAVVHAAVAVDHQPVQRGALQRHHLGGLLFPVRLQQLLLQQVARHAGNPLRFDRGQAAPEQTGGLHQLGSHQPAPGLLRQMRPGMAPELDAARPQVPVLVVRLAAHVAQQASQHRQVNLLVGGGSAVQAPAMLGHHGVQLGVDVAPFAHPARVDEAVAQPLLLLPLAELVGGCRSSASRPRLRRRQ